MGYLRRKSDGAVTELLPSDSVEYQVLSDLKDATGVNTLYEDVGEQDLVGVTVRQLVLNEPGAAIAATELITKPTLPGRPGTITAAQFFANAPGIVGVTTNTRTITLQQVNITATPARVVTVLTTLALVNGVNAVTGQAAAMTINSASFLGDGALQVNSVAGGTGIVDPGGLVVVTYTPA